MSAPIITTGQIAKLLWPGLNARWGVAYTEHPVEYTDLVDVFSSDLAYEEDQEMTGFGMAPIKTQGASIVYDTAGQGPTTRYTHIAYALGFIITHEAMMDNQYEKIGMQRTGSLAFSLRQTKENVVANLYNRGFSTSSYSARTARLARDRIPRSRQPVEHADDRGGYVGSLARGSGGPDHAGVNSRGMKIALMPEVADRADQPRVRGDPHPQVDRPERQRQQRDQRAEGDGRLPGRREGQPLPDRHGCVLHPHQCAGGLKLFQREEADVRAGRRLRHLQPQVQGYERYSVGWTDWRALYGSPGA
jgi:hypothetical protein